MTEPSGRHVVVIGAGAIGVISAIELLRDGHRVTVVEPAAPGGEQAASYGNAGWLSTHSVIPPAEPGVWKNVPKFLIDPLGPLAIRWSYLPKALPWLIKYLLSGWTEARVEATAQALRPLLVDAPALHKKLAEEAGVGHLIERQGLMHVYPSRAAFDADALGWSIRKRVGVTWMELSADEMRQREPDLHPRYQFGVLVEEAGRCRDPGGYVAALAEHARALGAEFVNADGQGPATGERQADVGRHRQQRDRLRCRGGRRRRAIETARRLDRRSPAAGNRARLSRHDRTRRNRSAHAR